MFGSSDAFSPDAIHATTAVDAESPTAGWASTSPGFTPGFQGLGRTANRDLERADGVFEYRQIRRRPNGVAHTSRASGNGCCTIIGGGDSVRPVEKVGVVPEKMSHIPPVARQSLELAGARCSRRRCPRRR